MIFKTHYRANNRNVMMRNSDVVDWPVIFGIVWTDVGQIAEGGDCQGSCPVCTRRNIWL